MRHSIAGRAGEIFWRRDGEVERVGYPIDDVKVGHIVALLAKLVFDNTMVTY